MSTSDTVGMSGDDTTMSERILEHEMVTLDREGDVFVLTMVDGENRWNTTFTRAMNSALDAIDATDGPAALVTTSADPKFFSNGLDLEWLSAEPGHRGGDREAFGHEFMAFMARVITMGVPTVAAIGGHAFGAGLMLSMCHDVRVMREDRGYLCANELDLGMSIPHAELALFRHKLSMPVFFETVQLARRWTGPDALAAGMVQHVAPLEGVLETARAKANELARLGANRELFTWSKEAIFGGNAAVAGDNGAAYMLRHPDDYPRFSPS